MSALNLRTLAKSQTLAPQYKRPDERCFDAKLFLDEESGKMFRDICKDEWAPFDKDCLS